MTKIWMILAGVAIFVTLAAITKNIWFPEGLRNRWHEAWISYPGDDEDPKKALLSNHARRMAGLESQYREIIEKEKAEHTELLAEKAKLFEASATP